MRCRGFAGSVLLVLVLWPGLGLAQAPSHGLMWNRTGLPAVFPLQVKTLAGQDYAMTLVDAETGTPALAAFIEGGRFFKVLVPPGVYDLRFAAGTDWQNEADLFGPEDTSFFTLDVPLRFAVLDAGTKGGHLIDMTQDTALIVVRARNICQRLAIARLPRRQAPFDQTEDLGTGLTEEGKIPRFPSRFSTDRLMAGTDRPVIPTDFAPYFSDPRFELRDFPC